MNTDVRTLFVAFMARFCPPVFAQFAIVLLFLATLFTTHPAYAQLQWGSLLLVDSSGGTNSQGSLLTVDQTTGDRAVFSDFGSPAQGPLGKDPAGVAVLSGLLGLGDAILVTDIKTGTNGNGLLFKIDQSTGIRTVLSDFGNLAQGPRGKTPRSLATTNGLLGIGAAILVMDSDAGTSGRGALFSVDPIVGSRKILSDFGDQAQGPIGVYPSNVIAAPGLLGLGTTQILVVDEHGGTNGRGAIFLVNSFTGSRTLLSDFGDLSKGQLGAHPVSAAVSPNFLVLSNTALILDTGAGANGKGALFIVDSSGFRTLLSDFGDSTQGPTGGHALRVAVVNNTEILVTDNAAGLLSKGALFSIDPNTGFRTLLSDFAQTLEGPNVGPNPVSIGWWP
jgi:hypothetical protein